MTDRDDPWSAKLHTVPLWPPWQRQPLIRFTQMLSGDIRIDTADTHASAPRHIIRDFAADLLSLAKEETP
jgi:hypothetical protein